MKLIQLCHFIFLFAGRIACFEDSYISQNGDLSHILINPQDNSVFVGGHNVLLKFTADLSETEMQKTFIGGPNCELCQLQNLSTDDNNVSVLLRYNEKILLCGTSLNGSCWFHNVTNIKHSSEILGPRVTDTGHFLGSSSAFVVYAGNGLFHSAMAYDGRPLSAFPKTISVRLLMDNMRMEYFNEHAKAYPQADDRHISDNQFEFIYGFKETSNVYFLRTGKNRQGMTVTALIESGTGYSFKYRESEIRCGGYTKATSAFHLQEETGNSTLYVTFGDPLKSGSTLCEFSVENDVKDFFNREGDRCKQGKSGKWPYWIQGTVEEKQRTCRKIEDKMVYTFKMSTEKAISKKEIFKSTELKVMTSLSAAWHNTTKVAFVGYSDGTLQKLIWTKEAGSLVVLDLKTKKKSHKINRNMKLAGNGRLYMTHGNTITALDTEACEIHDSCTGCLGDTHNCIWCVDMDTKEGRCSRSGETKCGREQGTTKYDISCPPVVTEFYPVSGPLDGGTVVKIFGELGNLNISQYYVTIAEWECPVIERHEEGISCRTGKTTSNFHQGLLKVKIFNNEFPESNPIGNVPINGTATSKDSYQFKKPFIHSVDPKYSMAYGGIPLTIFGKDLNIGSNRYVAIGNQSCSEIRSLGTDVLKCKIPSYIDGELLSHGVRLNIDNSVLWSPFCNLTYVQNPVVEKVTPGTIIQSGGTAVTLSGKHLKGAQGVYIVEQANDSPAQQKRPCKVTGENLECKTANITTPVAVNSTLKLFFASIYGSLDQAFNFSTVNYSSLVVVADPLLEDLGDLMVMHEDTPFVIKGSGFQVLGSSDINITFGTAPCDVTDLSSANITCSIVSARRSGQLKLDKRLPVTVRIGYLEKVIGEVIYKSQLLIYSARKPKDLHVNIGVVALSTVAGIVILVGLMYCLMKKMEIGPCKGREDLYAVSYRADGSEVRSLEMRSEGVTDASQNRLNLYQEQSTVAKSVVSDDNSNFEDDVPLLAFAVDSDTRNILEREDLLIEKDTLILGEVIGSGHFGCVYKGYLQLPGEKAEKIVAVKTLHRSDPKDMDVHQFVKEALIMKNFHHYHVMELLGICLGHRPLPLVILPFMQHGDLLTYLRDNKNLPTVKDLVTFGVDIASGMCYLSELKFVHRDLAARNCMLDNDLRVKVADFGLTRDVYEKEYYSAGNKNTKLPVKWMAPESLEFGVYSSKSDVWSYGVVLWELLTRGINPYPEVDNWDILRFLKLDRRMVQPNYCPEKMYRIMQRCWLWNPEERPTFGQLSEEIPDLLRQLEHSAGERGKRINIETTYVNFRVGE